MTMGTMERDVYKRQEQALSRALLAMEKALHAVGEEQTMEHLIAAHTGAPDAARCV